MSKKPAKAASEPPPAFDLHTFLQSAGLSRRITKFKRNAVVFAQGAQASSVYYVQAGGVQLSVLSATGKEAVVAMLGPGDFFGEGCLAAQSHRIGTAKAIMLTTVLQIPKAEMIRTLHEQPELADRFLTHMLARNIRIEEDLVDQLFNSSEKRLARPSCSWPATVPSPPRENCPSSRKRRSQTWWGRHDRASTSSWTSSESSASSNTTAA